MSLNPVETIGMGIGLAVVGMIFIADLLVGISGVLDDHPRAKTTVVVTTVVSLIVLLIMATIYVFIWF